LDIPYDTMQADAIAALVGAQIASGGNDSTPTNN
jgi:hypothetical protein